MGKSSARGGAVGVAPPTRGRDRLLSREVLARELLSPDQIDDLIRRESYRTDRNGREFSLVLFQLPPAERGLLGRLDGITLLGSAGRRRLPTQRRPTLACIRLARTLAHRSRAIDEIGWFNDHYVCALLPETSAAGARVFARHVCDLAVRHSPHDAPRPAATVYSYPSGWFVSAGGADCSAADAPSNGAGRRGSDARMRASAELAGRRAGEPRRDIGDDGHDRHHHGGNGHGGSNGHGGNGHARGNGHHQGNGNGNGHAHGNGNGHGNGHAVARSGYERPRVIFDIGHDTAYAGSEGPLKRDGDYPRRGDGAAEPPPPPEREPEAAALAVAAVAVAESIPEENGDVLPSPGSRLRRDDLMPFFLDGVAKGLSHPGLRDESIEQLLVRPMPAWKRALDLFGAIVGLIVLSPLFAVAAAAIRLSSPGPVIFRQRRAGLGGRPFTINKFRTMPADAEERKHELRDRSEQDGPAFKLTQDRKSVV